MGIVNERIASDTGLRLIGLGEAAVDDEQPAGGLDRAFALFDAHWHMAVDNVPLVRIQAKGGQQLPADLRLVVKGIIGILFLPVGALIRDEIPLKGGHAVLPI